MQFNFTLTLVGNKVTKEVAENILDLIIFVCQYVGLELDVDFTCGYSVEEVKS